MEQDSLISSRLEENEGIYVCYTCPLLYEYGDYIYKNGVDGIKSEYIKELTDICIKCDSSEKENFAYFTKSVYEDTRPKKVINKILSENFKILTEKCNSILLELVEYKRIKEN